MARGTDGGVPALIWETMFQAGDEEAAKTPDEIKTWVTEAHAVTGTWFFKLIEGDLERRFE